MGFLGGNAGGAGPRPFSGTPLSKEKEQATDTHTLGLKSISWSGNRLSEGVHPVGIHLYDVLEVTRLQMENRWVAVGRYGGKEAVRGKGDMRQLLHGNGTALCPDHGDGDRNPHMGSNYMQQYTPPKRG